VSESVVLRVGKLTVAIDSIQADFPTCGAIVFHLKNVTYWQIFTNMTDLLFHSKSVSMTHWRVV
jgi:hypothetical protein